MPEISKEEFARVKAVIERDLLFNGTMTIGSIGLAPVILAALDLAASASSPEPEEPAKPDRNRDRLLALLLNRRIDHHDVNACEAEAWGDGLPECVKYHNGQAKAYRAALEALERDAPSSRHSDGERR